MSLLTAKKKEPTICLSECISGSGPVFVEEETAGSTAFVKTSGRGRHLKCSFYVH
jgi:hypothetical protein